MVDFFKLLYREDDEFKELVMNESNFPDLEATIRYHTGEIKTNFKADFEGLDVRLNEKLGSVKNSLHKFYNNLKFSDKNNYTDFGYYAICEAIDIISTKFEMSSDGKLTQLEFGLNIIVDIPPETIVKRNFLIHKNEAGSRETYGGKGELKRFSHSNYAIKIYDKGKQSLQEQYIFRFEIKFLKAIEFQAMNIRTLNDLKRKESLRKLFVYLTKRYDEIVVVDHFDIDSIIELNDYNKLIRYTNPLFWSEEIKRKHTEVKARHWKKFNLLLIKNGLLETKYNIRKLLLDKFISLMNN